MTLQNRLKKKKNSIDRAGVEYVILPLFYKIGFNAVNNPQ